MKRIVYASLAMIAVFCCLNQALAAGTESPRMVISETSFDFKEAYEGEKVSHDFVVKNTGKGVLNISEVRRG